MRHARTDDRALLPLSWPRAALSALWALAVGLLLVLLLLPVLGCASAPPLADHPGVVVERLFEPARAPLPARWMVAIETADRLSVVEVDAEAWLELPAGTHVVLIGRRTPTGWSGAVRIQKGDRPAKRTPQRSAA